jgi:hypothetical protein
MAARGKTTGKREGRPIYLEQETEIHAYEKCTI